MCEAKKKVSRFEPERRRFSRRVTGGERRSLPLSPPTGGGKEGGERRERGRGNGGDERTESRNRRRVVGAERESRGPPRDGKSSLALEMPGDQLSRTREGQDSCRCQEFSSRVPSRREGAWILGRAGGTRARGRGGTEYLCNIAGSIRAFFFLFPSFFSFRATEKGEEAESILRNWNRVPLIRHTYRCYRRCWPPKD